ncbi:LysR family transcriptional regulator [Brevibacterium aurantiacum]|uniref:LysR family transcriptional regulator n=1 Tax=Brevibacterium aurantiacum TaxID=273384 RepID=UPI000F634FE3|nr:hypothetical protein CXR24_18660 [Brevibacterium aurantiacum]
MSEERIETYDLQVFLAVANTGSLGGAAGHLRLTTPSVSSRMDALERKIQAQLFTRSTHGSALTAAGIRLVPYAQRSLQLLQEARYSVSAETRSIAIFSAPASIADLVFPPVLLAMDASSVSCHCRIGHSEEIIGHLLDGTVDAGIVIHQLLPSALATHHIARSALIAVCRKGHRLLSKSQITMDDLHDQPVAVFRWGPDANALARAFEHSRPSGGTPVHLVGMPSAALELAFENDFVAIVPAYTLNLSRRSQSIVRLPLQLPGWSLDIQLAYRSDKSATESITDFADVVSILQQRLVPDAHL